MKKKILGKRAQAIQTKSVMWIIGVLVFAVLIFIIFKMDLFGYVKSLPSFGNVRSGSTDVELNDLALNIKCQNYIGGIGNEPLKEFGVDVRYFHFVVKGTEKGPPVFKQGDKKFVVNMEDAQGPKFGYVYNYAGGVKKFLGFGSNYYLVLGIFDPVSGKFRVSEMFQSLCGDSFSTDVPFFVNSEEEKKIVLGEAQKFVSENINACSDLQKLHGSVIYASRVLCKTKKEIKKEATKSFHPICGIINNYGSVRKIVDENRKALVENKNPLCEAPSTNPIAINFKNNWWWWPVSRYSPAGFFWNAEANNGKGKVYVRSDETKDEALKGPWSYSDLENKEAICEDYFPDMNCDEGDFANILKILETKTFNEFIFAVASVGSSDENWFTWGKGEIRKKATAMDVKKKILKKGYEEAWITPGNCLKEERIFSCSIGGKIKDCVLAEKCAYCFVETKEEDRECGKNCFCPQDYQEGYVFQMVVGDTLCSYKLNKGSLDLVGGDCKLEV